MHSVTNPEIDIEKSRKAREFLESRAGWAYVSNLVQDRVTGRQQPHWFKMSVLWCEVSLGDNPVVRATCSITETGLPDYDFEFERPAHEVLSING